MNFLLKIVEGPNRGAEIALVDGVAVTLGKGEDCDIVLADPTMPAEPLKIEVSDAGVMVGGEALEPLHVKTVGATAFAVGPADAPWGALVWPKVEEEDSARSDAEAQKDAPREPDAGNDAARSAESKEKTQDAASPREEKKRHGGCLGCLVALIVLLLVLAGLAWFFRDRVKETDWSKLDWQGFTEIFRKSGSSGVSAAPAPLLGKAGLSAIAAKYGLAFSDADDSAKISGNLATRRERLAATAEAYEAMPGVDLDITDDESFRTAAEDALFTLTEGALKVSVATNRFLCIAGCSPSPVALKKTLEALNADLPKLRNVDLSGVRFNLEDGCEAVDGDEGMGPVVSRASRKTARAKSSRPQANFPVCGILTVPYPCLVMRDGRRILEGASIGDSVILKIEADSVTVTNATGRFEWKP